MTKRIVSGIFILTALGALGVILAGALTSGEQLIVRFLTAVIVAALGLYVISDLRLQADDDAAGMRSGVQPRLAGIDAPPNSTAAFMATVTGKGDSPVALDPVEAKDELAEDEDIDPKPVVGTTSSSTSEHDESAVVEDAGSPARAPVPSVPGPAPITIRAEGLPNIGDRKPATITDLFARRSKGESVDRTWPTIGVLNGTSSPSADVETDESATTDGHEANEGEQPQESTFFAERPAAEAADDSGNQDSGNQDSGNQDSGKLDHGNAAEQSHADGADDDQAAEQAIDATATTDLPATEFEYSGDLESPVFEWPAAATDEPANAVATSDVTSDVANDEQPASPISIDVSSSEAPDTYDNAAEISASFNGADRPIPSPFLPSPVGGSAVDYADAPLAPIIDLRHAAGSTSSDVDEAIKDGEVEVVAALIEQGMLSTDGPISDRDVRTMVYVAFTSNELRKLLVAGGSPDTPNPGIDLGPVELFKEGMVQPPKTLYAGPPVEAEARSQLG